MFVPILSFYFSATYLIDMVITFPIIRPPYYYNRFRAYYADLHSVVVIDQDDRVKNGK